MYDRPLNAVGWWRRAWLSVAPNTDMVDSTVGWWAGNNGTMKRLVVVWCCVLGGGGGGQAVNGGNEAVMLYMLW